jgi:hypothetical protein
MPCRAHYQNQHNRAQRWNYQQYMQKDDQQRGIKWSSIIIDMNPLVLLMLLITSSLASVGMLNETELNQIKQNKKRTAARLFLHLPFRVQTNYCIHKGKNGHFEGQMCVCLRGSSSRWLGSSLLSCGSTRARSGCCRWRNIHLSSAKNLSNNPMLIFAQGPTGIQLNLKRYHPAIIKKRGTFGEGKCCSLYCTFNE